jgi:hypothetical protein
MPNDPSPRRGRAADISIDAPVARHGDVVPAVEDRSYVLFIAGAMFVAIAGGFVLGTASALAESGVAWGERAPWLIQAHGAAQLEGWAGLFVAGMALRLLPRFAGRRPLKARINLLLFALLFSGVVIRTIAQSAAGDGPSAAGVLAGQVLWGAGALALGMTVLVTLARGRKRNEPWAVFAFAGAAWWLIWGATSLVAGARAANNDAYIPTTFDNAMAWMVMLGAIGNFIWGVQSRSVPIFFGRKVPKLRQVIVPAVLLNAGVLLIFVSGWLAAGTTEDRLMRAGLALAGAALVWLPWRAGSCWGAATRLRPRARAAARFVLIANLAAVACGILLLWAGIAAADHAFDVRDGARHAFGVGVITMLIVGMAQLVAPFFALRRIESHGDWVMDRAVLGLLVMAAILRVAASLLAGLVPFDMRMHAAAFAGVCAWVALVLFAATVARAIRAEPRIKAALSVAAGITPK